MILQTDIFVYINLYIFYNKQLLQIKNSNWLFMDLKCQPIAFKWMFRLIKLISSRNVIWTMHLMVAPISKAKQYSFWDAFQFITLKKVYSLTRIDFPYALYLDK